jgi:hypothetical protein
MVDAEDVWMASLLDEAEGIGRAAIASPSEEPGGVTTQCPQIGVHDHPFRGPHTFTESYADAIASPSEEPGLDVATTCLDYAAHRWNSNGSPSFCRDCGIEFPTLTARAERVAARLAKEPE